MPHSSIEPVIITQPFDRALANREVRREVLGRHVHHEQDGCRHWAFADTPILMRKLVNAPRKQLLPFTGGDNRGDPCEAMAYHGFNGLERDVVRQMTAWMLAK